MKAAIGLGNPGDKYRGTRHNVGFDVVEGVYRSDPKDRRDFELKRFVMDGTELAFVSESPKGLLVMPQLYMNNSGPTVRAVSRHYKVERPDLLVICDDVHLPLGQLRFRKGGTSGGHNGLQSVIEAVGSEEVERLRIGVGSPRMAVMREFVLDHFDKDEQALRAQTLERAAEAVRCWFDSGIEVCMNRYNVKTSE